MNTKFKATASIVLVLLLCVFVAKADKPRAKGYYIDKTGNKIIGSVEVPTKMLSKKAETIQLNHFTFFDKRGKKLEMTEKEASEFGFNYEGEDIVFRVLPEVIQKSTMVKANFYKLLIDGPCSLYLVYIGYSSGFYSQYLLFKDEGHYFMTTEGTPTNELISAPGRIKNTSDLFEDCPELVEKIKNKEYKKGDDRYFRLANYYNASCTGSSVEEKDKSED
jgi:hypothetical protein